MQSNVTTPPAVRGKRGIFYGWWIVAAGFLANFAYAEQFNTSYGVFIYELDRELSWGRTTLAGASTASRIPEALLASVLGPVVDRFGARWLMGLGGLLVGGAFLALSTIDQLWQLYLYKGVVMSVGSLCLGGYIGVTISNWFVARRGRAIAVITMGSFLATGAMPLAAAFMIDTWGWRQAWLAMGLLVWLLALPSVIVFRRRPEDMGLHPDGVRPEEARARPVVERERRRREALLAADVVWTRGEIVRTPVLWVMIFAWGLSQLAVTGTNLHLVSFVQGLGYPLVIAAAGLSLRATSALIGSPLWGLVVERIPINLAASVHFVCAAVAMLAFLLYPTPLGLISGLVLYGIAVAGAFVVQDTIWANYYGRMSLGLVRSIAMPLQTGLAALGPVVIGLLFDLSGNYQSAWLFLFSGFVLSAIVIQFSRPPRARRREAVGSRQ